MGTELIFSENEHFSRPPEGGVAKSEGAAVPHAVLAGGLGLHHQRTCPDMPGWSGQHLCYGPGTVGCGVHYP